MRGVRLGSTVRDAATSACAATWPPNTIGRVVGICAPRNRSSSIVSRSSSATQLVGVARHQSAPVLARDRRAVEPGQELLELLADLLAGRQRLVAGQQAGAALLGALERVVLPLQGGDHVGDLLVGGEVADDLGLAVLGLGAQPGQVDGQPAGDLDLLEQRGRGPRVVHLREVVRDVRDEAHRVVAPLAEPDLQQRLGTARDPQLAAPRALAGEQVGVVGVVGDRDRPGVRHRHRHRAHADDAGHAEALDDLAHRAAERLPAVVGLRPLQQEVRRPAGVLEQPDDQPRRVVRLVVVAHEGHRGPAGAVVVELVDVEGRHDAARRRGRRGAGRRGPRRCRRRGSRRAPAPSSGGRHPGPGPAGRARRRRCGRGGDQRSCGHDSGLRRRDRCAHPRRRQRCYPR